MDILEEIRYYFTVDSGDDHRLWKTKNAVLDHELFCSKNNGFLVFIASDMKYDPFRFTFSGFRIESCSYDIGDGIVDGVRIVAIGGKTSISAILSVLRSFLFPVDGTLDDSLANPQKWVEEWKNSVGNRLSKEKTYQIIGELLSYQNLMELGYTDVVWEGPYGSIIDLSAKSGADTIYAEVKSTVLRNESKVVMPEEYEVEKAHYLQFHRFEESPSGELSLSIQIERLEASGCDDEMIARLNSMLEKDSDTLNKKYHLVETRTYLVDDDFPNIKKGFINGVKPPGIGRIQYEVYLDGLVQTELPHSLLNRC